MMPGVPRMGKKDDKPDPDKEEKLAKAKCALIEKAQAGERPAMLSLWHLEPPDGFDAAVKAVFPTGAVPGSGIFDLIADAYDEYRAKRLIDTVKEG